MPSGPASSEDVRRHNLGSLLRLLHVDGATSRSDLATRTGLNRSTVGALTGQLAEAGLVEEMPPAATGAAGRPSILVCPRRTTYALAVEIGVERLVAARVGLGGVVLDRTQTAQDERRTDPLDTVERVGRALRELLALAPAEDTCVGAGVAVCGLVRESDGTVRFAPNLSWSEVPLARLLAPHLPPGLPLLVGNEADLGALAEHLRGAGRGVADMVYLSGEVGVGSGIVVSGRPLRGAGGYAGELGHVLLNPAGHACRCGRTGCWETEVGEDAVLRATGSPRGTSWEAVLAAARRGDPSTVAGLQQVGRWLGVGIADLVNLLNPELVLFGGLTRDLFPAAEQVVRAAVAEALPGPRQQVRLELPGLGADSNLVGAAELAFAPLLDDPLGVLAQVGAVARPPRPVSVRTRRPRPAQASRR